MRILFVCLGNICRSPTAEAVLRAKAPGVRTDSAGTGDWHIGAAPYGPMQDTARARGYDMSGQRARQLGLRDYGRFDLILGMDSDNLQDIHARAPEGTSAQIGLLTDYLPDADGVPDPYYTRDFDGALALIEASIDALLEEIA